jgi:4'-phosphopantetheinyl transferase
MNSTDLSPTLGTVDVWVVDLYVLNHTLHHVYELLGEDERQRAERFRFPIDRRRFVVARATLREILGRYLQTAPERLEFEYGEYGKPKLSKPHTGVRFNASRSGERALIACTQGHEIGVDIESLSRELEIDDLSRRFFTASENQKLASFPADRRKEAFLRCWTCKEAFIKAVGKGVSLGLDKFDVSLGVGNPEADVSSAIDSFVVDTCSLIPLMSSALEGYVSALAIDGEEAKVSIRSWVRSV